jgi:membrane peptidoglycan carboxypeptidase
LLLITLIAVVGLTFYVFRVIKDMEIGVVDITKEKKPPVASEVFDRDGKLIGKFFLQERYYKPLSEISEAFKNTVIAAEDERFYMHKGFDVKGILRAVYYKISRGGQMHGGSTITQQVARSELYLAQKERDLERKIKEIYLAYQLEKLYTKDEILEAYCNQPAFGFQLKGVEAAARYYFGKNAKDLDYAESAMLCGILPSPSISNPITDPEWAKRNQLNVLRKLKDNGYITEEERQIYAEKELDYDREYTEIRYRDNINYFLDFVKDEMLNIIDDPNVIEEGGLRIHTTLNYSYQQNAESAIDEFYEEVNFYRKDVVSDEGVHQPQSSIVSTNPKTGEILAMMGGRNYNESEYNRVVVPQPPGSSFKIFDYTSALENKSLAGGSILVSDDFTVEGYTPGEWTWGEDRFGKISVRQALIDSSNVCAMRAGLRAGLRKVGYTANKMGISTEVLPYPSMTVGGMDVKAVDMACAYSCLASGGIRNDPYSVEFVQLPDGREIYRHREYQVRILDEDVSWLMTNLFQSVHRYHGLSGWKGFDTNVAGKTGTSGEEVAGWYCCYTPNIVTIAYTGVDDKEYRNVWIGTPWGSSVAKPLAGRYMVKCLEDSKYPLEKEEFPPKPEGVNAITICKHSGHLVTEYCPEKDRITEYYIEGTEPTRYCQYHAEPMLVFPVVVGDDGEYYKPVNNWCPSTHMKMTQNEYDELDYCETSLCPPLLDDIIWTQIIDGESESQSGEGNTLVLTEKDGAIEASVSFIVTDDRIDSIKITFDKNRVVKKWKIGNWDYDLGKTLSKEDFASGLKYEHIRYQLPEDKDIETIEVLIEMNGPGNFYSTKRYETTIISPKI